MPGSESDRHTENQTAPVDHTADFMSLLGDETRLRILTTLHDHSIEAPMDFSTLYESVDANYSSGFNYHLDKLTPHFVTKQDSSYRLTAFGKRVARAIAVGTFSNKQEKKKIRLDESCFMCGKEELNASYDGDMFTVECDHCKEVIIHIQLPPNLLQERNDSSFIDTVDRWLHQWMQMSISLYSNGVCYHCGGSVDTSIVDDVQSYDRLDTLVRFDCAHCGEITRATIGAVASQKPKVKYFIYTREEQIEGRRYWELEQLVSDQNQEVLSRNPWLFRVSFQVDGDRFEVIINEDLEITDYTVFSE